MEYIVSFIILIGILVWVHEFGHFLFAKLFGVKVETFSIGFGPTIISKKIGETDYRISAIPLGGYVKMYGEEDGIQDPRSFSSKPNWQKIIIAFGGPLFNFLFAILVFSFLYNLPRKTPAYIYEKPIVGHVIKNSPAQSLGIKPGDEIIQINSIPINSWKDMEKAIAESSIKKEWTVKVKREGEIKTLRGNVSLSRSVGFGAEPSLNPKVGKVIPNTPAHQVGIKEGDIILSVNQKEIRNWNEAVEVIRNSKGNPISLKIKRGEEILDITVVPKLDEKTGLPILGVSPYVETTDVKLSMSEAIREAINRTIYISTLSLKAVWALITGSVSFDNLGGPIAIAQLAGESAQHGLITFLGMMAFISIQLAIFNLLPLPVLDGGLILLFLVESIKGSPLSPRFKENWQRLGFALIITLSVFVMINDILRIITGRGF